MKNKIALEEHFSIEGMTKELERCVKQLGFKGALVNGYSNTHNVNTIEYTDEPSCEVFRRPRTFGTRKSTPRSRSFGRVQR